MGVDIRSILNDMNAPLPNYRFSYRLQKALELCGELKVLGNALLSALEKKDAEKLSMIRSDLEISILRAVRDARQLQADEANAAKRALEKTRDVINVRYEFYNTIKERIPEENNQLIQELVLQEVLKQKVMITKKQPVTSLLIPLILT